MYIYALILIAIFVALVWSRHQVSRQEQIANFVNKKMDLIEFRARYGNRISPLQLVKLSADYRAGQAAH